MLNAERLKPGVYAPGFFVYRCKLNAVSGVGLSWLRIEAYEHWKMWPAGLW